MVTVNASMPAVAAAAGPGAGAAAAAEEGAVGAPSSCIEADVVDTVPKTMQDKAKRLMEHLKDISRGPLVVIHEDVTIAGSDVVDLVNDLLLKRKTDPTGWQPFAQQLRTINLPI